MLQVADLEIGNTAKPFGARVISSGVPPRSWMDMELQDLVFYKLGFGVALV